MHRECNVHVVGESFHEFGMVCCRNALGRLVVIKYKDIEMFRVDDLNTEMKLIEILLISIINLLPFGLSCFKMFPLTIP